MNASSRFACAVAATFLVFSTSGAAQDPGNSRTGAMATIAIDFPGGTLGQYITMLRDAGGSVNVAMSSTAARDVPLPPIHLDAVTPSAAVCLLENSYDLDPNNSVRIRVEKAQGVESDPSSLPIYRISAERTMVKVWNVLDLFCDDVVPGDVLTAIESAVEVVSEKGRNPTILFHESTGVLITRGTPRQVETIGRVLDELRGHLILKEIFGGWEKISADESGPAMLAELQSQVSGLRNRLQALEARCCVEKK